MTSNAITAVECIFRESWRLFTSWHIPGTNISPAAWLVFAVVFFIGLKMVFGILGMTGVFGTYGFERNEAERRLNGQILYQSLYSEYEKDKGWR